jgi:hypothetical protein
MPAFQFEGGPLGRAERRISMGAVVALLVIFVAFVLPIIPARLARNKGRSFWGFYFFGMLFLIPSLIACALLGPKSFAEGDVVKLSINVKLTKGGTVPAGWVSKVLATDVIDGNYVLEITDPSGEGIWVGRGALKQA